MNIVMLVSARQCISCLFRRSSIKWHTWPDVISCIRGRWFFSSQAADGNEQRHLTRMGEALKSDLWISYLNRLEKKIPAVGDTTVSHSDKFPTHMGDAQLREGKNNWDLRRLGHVVQDLRSKENELKELQQLLRDESEDMRTLANTEIESCQEEIEKLKHQIAGLLIQREEADDNDLIVEVTAGVGGQEAMLFTAEVFDMYQHYASHKNWSFDILEYYPSDLEKNLQLEPILESKRQAILDKYELLTQMKATFEKKLQRQHELSESCSLSALQARLKVAAHEAEEESDSIAEDFLEGKIEIEDFLNVFMEKRTCCHSRRAKEEKLQQAISLHSQYHAPL